MKAPKGETWLCAACSNVNDDRSAMPAACCQQYAMLVEKASIVRSQSGRIIECAAAIVNKGVWR